MRKKFSTFILAICFLLPFVFMMTACGEPPHVHEFIENPTNAFLKTDATCTSGAIYYKSCACGEKSTQTFEVGEPLGHNYYYVSNGDGTHEKVCENDPAHNSRENCSGERTSCLEQAYCDVCHEYYGEPGNHEFTQEVATDDYLKEEATCTHGAEYYYSCECGEIGEDTFFYGEPVEHKFTQYLKNNDATCEEDGTKTATCDFDGCNEKDTITDTGSAKGHNYGAWINNGNGEHVKTCSNDHSHTVTENCSGGTATCTQKAICSVCNTEYGNKASHTYTEGVCEDCDEPKPSEGLEFMLSEDGKYYIVVGLGDCEDTDIVIPDEHNNLPVTHIKQYAFQNTDIESIYIPYSITNIEGRVFDGCTSLTTVTIGENVTAIGLEAFLNCTNITRVNYKGTIDKWVEIDLYPFSNPLYFGAGLYIDNQLVTEVNITTATKVKQYAFCGYTSLTSVTLGNSVTSIGGYAFYACSSLETVVIGDGVITIQGYAFKQTNLTDLTIGKKVARIDFSAFSECENVYYTGTIDNWVEIEFAEYESNPIVLANFYIDDNLVTEVNLTTATKVGKYAFYCYENLTTVTLGESVKSIGYQAFYQTSKLESVTIGSGVELIDTEAFYGCSKLTNIVVPGNVKTIGNEAFAGCVNLATVTINEGVENIKEAAFRSSGVTSITIPNSVTSLEKSAFENCSSLAIVIIGNGLETIEEKTFYSCSNLINLTIGENVVQINAYAFSNCSNLESVTFPDSVAYLWQEAFANCYSLKNITIGKNTEFTISDDTFKECNLLENIYYTGDVNGWVQYIYGLDSLMDDDYTNLSKKIYIGGELLTEVNLTTATYINDCVFRGYDKLTSVTIGESVEVVGGSAFEYCTNLTTVNIGNGTTIISTRAFENCAKLKTLTLGNSLENIGDSAFYNCSSLESVITPDSLIFIGSYAFSNCANLSTLTLGNSVETIGERAFEQAKITTLIIPDSVTILSSDAFSGCSSLTSVKIGNGVETIGSNAFANCGSLTSVTFGNNVKLISQAAFYACSNLTSIVIPDTVTAIGSNAFYECENLMSVIIGSGVETIGSGAFNDCLKLIEVINKSSLNITKGGSSYGGVAINALKVKTEGTSDIANVNNYLFYTVDGVNYLVGYTGTEIELTLPENYNGQNYKIYDYAFLNCDKAVNLIISDGVTTIGNNIFYYDNKLTSVTVGRNVTKIEENAFFYCDRIVEVINYSSLNITLYDSNANGYISANAIKVKTEGPSDIVNVDGYLFCSLDGVNYLVGYAGTETELTLPEDYKGQKYVIYRNAFADSNITSVIISKNVSRIESYAFADCLELKTVILKDNTTRIEIYAFNQCPNIQYNEYKNAYYLGNDIRPYLYLIKAKSTDITTCEVNIGCKLIAGGAFYGCTKLTDITLSTSIETIESYAFNGCTSLTTISIPEDIRHIEDYVFADCSNLQYNEYDNALYLGNESNPYLWLITVKSIHTVSYEINENCKKIAGGAFAFCYAESIFIPESIVYIGEGAFYYCSSLRHVYYEGNQIEWAEKTEIMANNDGLTVDTIYFYSETEPQADGNNYWHYVDGEITSW